MWSIFLYVVCLLYILDEVFLFKHFAQFLIGLFVSLLISTYLYILDDNILSDTSFINISSSLCLLFSLFLTVYFAEQKFLILMTSNYVVVQSLSCVQLFATPWTAAQQVSLSFTVAQSLLKFISIESVMPSNHLILCFPLLLLPSIFPSIKVFSNELAIHNRWPKYWSFSISPFNDYSGLISLRIDCLDLLAVQETLKSLLQHQSSKAAILRRSAFFTDQLSHSYMTTGKTIALTRRTFVGKVISLLFNMLSRLVITYLPRIFRVD